MVGKQEVIQLGIKRISTDKVGLLEVISSLGIDPGAYCGHSEGIQLDKKRACGWVHGEL